MSAVNSRAAATLKGGEDTDVQLYGAFTLEQLRSVLLALQEANTQARRCSTPIYVEITLTPEDA